MSDMSLRERWFALTLACLVLVWVIGHTAVMWKVSEVNQAAIAAGLVQDAEGHWVPRENCEINNNRFSE